MVKEIRKIGNSKGIILDAATLDAMNVDVGDKIEVTTHSSGAVTLNPISTYKEEDFDNVLNEVMEDYKDTLKKLS